MNGTKRALEGPDGIRISDTDGRVFVLSLWLCPTCGYAELADDEEAR